MPQAYAALIVGGRVLIGRKSMVNVGENPAPWTNAANGGYQWALPGGGFDGFEPQTNPLLWHACAAGAGDPRRAVNAAKRELEEETGLVLDEAALDADIIADPAGHFYLVTFTAWGIIPAPLRALLTSYAADYTILAQPLALALCNPAVAAVGAVANVRAQWNNASVVRGLGPRPAGCSAFRAVCDFEFSELHVVQLGQVGNHLGQPQTYAGAVGEEARITNYAGGLGGGRRNRLRYTLQVNPLPVGAAPPGGANPAQVALQIEWFDTIAGWLDALAPPLVAPGPGPGPGGPPPGPPPGDDQDEGPPRKRRKIMQGG